jgi:hypothetical protein
MGTGAQVRFRGFHVEAAFGCLDRDIGAVPNLKSLAKPVAKFLTCPPRWMFPRWKGELTLMHPKFIQLNPIPIRLICSGYWGNNCLELRSFFAAALGEANEHCGTSLA